MTSSAKQSNLRGRFGLLRRYRSSQSRGRTVSAREITMRHRTENGSIKQRNGAGPAGRAAFHFVREARDDEAVVGKPFQIAQLLHMATGNLAAGFVAFPDDRWVMRFEPALAGVHEGRVPAPGIDAGAARSAGVDENDVERLEVMADAFEFDLDLGGRDNMAVRNFTEIELDAGTEKPVERHLIDSHHRFVGASICVPLWVLSWISSMAQPSPSGRSSRRKPGNSSHNSGAVSALL